jgi:hypothetical protein
MFNAPRTRAILTAALITAAAPSVPWPAVAQTSDPQAVAPDFRQLRSDAAQARTPEAMFAVFDVDRDGCIDDGEWRRRSMAVFFILDTQGTDPVMGGAGDGQLTRAEVPNLREDLFRAADANRDGMISAFEFNQASFTRYDAVTKQTPRCVTLAEFTAYLQTLRPRAF